MNEIITFQKDIPIITFDYLIKPVISVNTIIFDTKDKGWANRIYTSYLMIKIEQFNKDTNLFLGSEEHPLMLGQFVSINHIEPQLNVNRTFTFVRDSDVSSVWKVSISLKDLTMETDEKLNVSLMDNQYIEKRINDWEHRVLNLYSEISTWLKAENNYSINNTNNVIMDESMMKLFGVPPKKIPTLDIFYDNFLKLTFKPKGLWVLGANGRIDILSLKNGGLILIDKAENFTTPKWYLVDNQKDQKIWSKELLFNLITG